MQSEMGPKPKIPFFEMPFDEKKVAARLKAVLSGIKENENNEVKIFQEKIVDNLFFCVYTSENRLAFFIGGENGMEGNAIFIFLSKDGEFSLVHREVDDNLKEKGMNGSILLKKAEEFARIFLSCQNNKEIKRFLIDAGQTGVVEWAIKNGYKFRREEYAKFYEEMKADSTDEFKIGNKYAGYMIKKENMPAARKSTKKRFKAGLEPGLREFAVRFELVKDV